MELNGIFVLDKEAGVTSRSLDNALAKRFGCKKVGHLGTLDPFATGLMLLAVGKATKCLPYLSDGKKTYIASLVLGKKTSTGDKDGEVILEKEIPTITDKEILSCLLSFLGKGKQIPPMTSAIKINGEPLYKKARKGIEVERKSRDIEIYDIRLLLRLGKRIDFMVCVSSGTYIRTLGEDIAEKLGCVGYLDSLRRIAIGNIDIREGKKLENLELSDLKNPLRYISLPLIEAREDQIKLIQNGVALSLENVPDQFCFYRQEEALAIYQKEEDGRYHCLRGLF